MKKRMKWVMASVGAVLLFPVFYFWFSSGVYAPMAILLTPFVLPTLYATPVYWADPIEAWVVDVNTEQPLEGVIVIASWELQSPFEGHPAGNMMVMETVTDAHGRFSFPAWGPALRWPPTSQLMFQDPALTLFKSGYKGRGEQNEVKSHLNYGPVRQSDWNGKTIKLDKFEGSLAEYGKRVSFLDDVLLAFAFSHHDCSWQQIPRMLAAIEQERRHLKENNVPNDLKTLEERDRGQNDRRHCPSIPEFLRSYLS